MLTTRPPKPSCVCVYTRIPAIFRHIYIYIYMCVCVCVCMCVCIYIYIYIYIYIKYDLNFSDYNFGFD